MRKKQFLSRAFDKARVPIVVISQLLTVAWLIRFMFEDGNSYRGDILLRIMAVVAGASIGFLLFNKYLIGRVQSWLNKARNQFFYVVRTWLASAGVNIISVVCVLPLTLGDLADYEPFRLLIGVVMGQFFQ